MVLAGCQSCVAHLLKKLEEQRPRLGVREQASLVRAYGLYYLLPKKIEQTEGGRALKVRLDWHVAVQYTSEPLEKRVTASRFRLHPVG